MKEYKITYLDPNGDYTSIWLEANDITDAKQQFFREYWDCFKILDMTELNK